MMILTAAALLVAAPANEAKAAPATKSETTPNAKAKTPDFAEILRMMDKIFPPQPEPDPARLALARTSATGLLPDGTYGRAMGGMIESFGTRILNMSEADLGMPTKDGKPASTETLHDSLVKDDPHFDERLAIIKRILGEELARLSTMIEPRLREGLARSMARRLDARQLAELNAFLLTESGKAYGQQSIAMWFDTDVIRSMFSAMPDLVMAAPGVAARIEKETAHLPKPKKKEKEKEKPADKK